MSWLLTRIAPSILAFSTRSFIRLKQRSSVLFPQPEGPMNAVTLFRRIVRLISFSAWDPPYQKESDDTSTNESLDSAAPSSRPAGANPGVLMSIGEFILIVA